MCGGRLKPAGPEFMLDVVYEDEYCLIFDKKAGLPVQGGSGVRTSVDSILAKTYKEKPFLVHRLDKDTAGLLLTAKGPENARYFSEIFAGKSRAAAGGSSSGRSGNSAVVTGPEKYYLALSVSDKDAPVMNKSGIIKRKLMIKGAEKEAVTGYRILKEFPLKPSAPEGDNAASGLSALNGACCEEAGVSRPPVLTLFELKPETGRTHQIRRTLALEGRPVIGDDKYGNFRFNRIFRAAFRFRNLFLFAYRLIVPLPGGGTAVAESSSFKASLAQFISS